MKTDVDVNLQPLQNDIEVLRSAKQPNADGPSLRMEYGHRQSEVPDPR